MCEAPGLLGVSHLTGVRDIVNDFMVNGIKPGFNIHSRSRYRIST